MDTKDDKDLTIKEIKNSTDRTSIIFYYINKYIRPLLRYVNVIIDEDGYLTMFGTNQVYKDTKDRYYRVLRNDLEFLRLKESMTDEHVQFNPFFDTEQMIFMCLLYKSHLANIYADEQISVKDKKDALMDEIFNDPDSEEYDDEISAFLKEISDEDLADEDLDLDLDLNPEQEDEVLSLSYHEDPVTKLHHYAFVKFPKTENEEILCEGIASDRRQSMFLLVMIAFIMHNSHNKNRDLKSTNIDNIEILAMKLFNIMETIIRKIKIDRIDENENDINFVGKDEENVVDITDDENEKYVANEIDIEETDDDKKEKTFLDIFKEVNSDINDENDYADFG